LGTLGGARRRWRFRRKAERERYSDRCEPCSSSDHPPKAPAGRRHGRSALATTTFCAVTSTGSMPFRSRLLRRTGTLSAVTQSREIGGRPRCCFIRTTESRAYFCRLLRPHGPPKARYAWRSRCRNALMISARRSMHGSVTDARTLPPRQTGAPDTRYERAQFDEEWHSRSSAERDPLPFSARGGSPRGISMCPVRKRVREHLSLRPGPASSPPRFRGTGFATKV